MSSDIRLERKSKKKNCRHDWSGGSKKLIYLSIYGHVTKVLPSTEINNLVIIIRRGERKKVRIVW